MKRFIIAAALVGATLAAAPASAQPQQGLVNVNITDVSLLNDLQVQAPITVQLPISAAANVCNVTVGVLAQDLADDGKAECNAVSSNAALIRAVNNQRQR